MNENNKYKMISFAMPWHYVTSCGEEEYIRVNGYYYEEGTGKFYSHDDVFDSLQHPHTSNEKWLGESLKVWNMDVDNWEEIEKVVRRINFWSQQLNQHDLEQVLSFNEKAWNNIQEVSNG